MKKSLHYWVAYNDQKAKISYPWEVISARKMLLFYFQKSVCIAFRGNVCAKNGKMRKPT